MSKRKGWLVFLAVIWIIMFATSPLRSRLLLIWRGGPQTGFTVIPSGYPKNFWPTLAKQNPPSAALQFINIANKSTLEPETDLSYLSQIDQLIEKYPHDAWLPAMRLRLTLASFKTNRVAGELSDPNFSENLKAGKPSPEISPAPNFVNNLQGRNLPSESSTISKPNFNKSDLAAALRICEFGINREPQNSYYDWIQSFLYWISWQDDKARDALRDGASKSDWNSHLRDFFKASEQGYHQAVRRPLLAMEKIEIIRAVPIYDALRQYREIARIITWSAIKDRRSGNNARALQTLADTHHLMHLAQHGTDYMMDSLVINAIMAIAESGAYTPSRKVLLANLEKPNYKVSLEQRQQSRLAVFVALAKSQHRMELAKQIKKEGRERIALWKQRTEQSHQNSGDPIIDFRYVASMVGWHVGVALILILLGSITLWIFVATEKYFLQQNLNSDNFLELPTGEIIQGALASGGVTAVVWTAILFGVITLVMAIDAVIANIIANVLAVILAPCLIFILVQSIRKLIRLMRVVPKNKSHYIYPIIYLILSTTALAVLAATWPYFHPWIDDRFPLELLMRHTLYDTQSPIVRWMADAFATFTDPSLDIYQTNWRIAFAAIPLIFGGVFFVSKIMERQAQFAAKNAFDNPRAASRRIGIWIAKRMLLVYLFFCGLSAFSPQPIIRQENP